MYEECCFLKWPLLILSGFFNIHNKLFISKGTVVLLNWLVYGVLFPENFNMFTVWKKTYYLNINETGVMLSYWTYLKWWNYIYDFELAVSPSSGKADDGKLKCILM
jgi:hypothetical protein